MNIVDTNSVPVLIKELENEEKILNEEYEELVSLELQKREQEETFSTLLSTSSIILENPKLKRIKKTKLKYVNHYLNNILGISNEFVMTSSWLTMNHNGSAHERHSHGNVILSSVLYFCENLSDETMSPFYIHQSELKNIFQNFQFEYSVNKMNQYNSPNLRIPTKTNLLIVFPGWMKHGSEPMNKNTKRYCIGSNYFLNDHVGNGYHSLSVKSSIRDEIL